MVNEEYFDEEYEWRAKTMDSSFYGPREYYVKGILDLEEWYGDKAYREYAIWFQILDNLWETAERYWNE